MEDVACSHDVPNDEAFRDRKDLVAESMEPFGVRGAGRNDSTLIPVDAPDDRDGRTDKPLRIVGDGLEHWLKLERRAADDAKYVPDRGLAIQRLLGLVEEPHVLHRDDGLVGKRADEIDLTFGEWPNFRAIEDEDPEHDFVSHQRDSEDRAEATCALQVESCVFGISEDIDYVHDLALERGGPNEAAAVGRSGLD